jgi:hypothetical protein
MKYQEEIQALLKKAERSLRAASSMIDSQDLDFSLQGPTMQCSIQLRPCHYCSLSYPLL